MSWTMVGFNISVLYAERSIWTLKDDGRCAACTKGLELILYLPQVEFKKAVSGDFFAEKHTFISTFGMACPSIVLAIKPIKGATGRPISDLIIQLRHRRR
jgi:hypothetical protein